MQPSTAGLPHARHQPKLPTVGTAVVLHTSNSYPVRLPSTTTVTILELSQQMTKATWTDEIE
jgi:hypothetical protein